MHENNDKNNILKLITRHLQLHPLIPHDNNEYFSINEIWVISVREMYDLVKRQGVYPFLKYEKRDQENGDNSQKNKICVAFSNSNALRDVANDLVINNGSIQNNEEIKDGELIFAELETY
ncbi:hypothetical protein C1646_811572 [Rhizophagus diaphanus]|nr:hypothetical protein C1646_811572 [Rhizophagus diaphanus] [Rhizophagus sp. MUCL 43196]